ncbi:DUF2388 domain-containing protein [Pseudomonas turukhanskensis]|uniref:Holliday junction resolvasome, helicase subunit n=1 Tax=Pseudomonas turukhanskensis TaxID=1806536 RepID=A0A9W6K0V5_9PSED|nr:DUF2388 domain-containing protein [Pseudomonas turukhanskensis]GLK87450.1 hypothetical protein GCM10017655_05120 [Pseudomonas turukhanskensis]
MTTLRLLSAATLLALATSASATSFVYTTDAVVGALKGTSDITSDISSSFNDDKIVLAAREDAASFVATNGDIRGVRLEAALAHIREKAPQLQARSDLQLAQSILVL